MSELQHISIEETKALLKEGAAIIDIRDEASFNTSHIEGAIHLSDANVQEFIRDSDLDKALIVYCYHGHSSQGAAQFLAEQGFENVYSMIGGYSAWS